MEGASPDTDRCCVLDMSLSFSSDYMVEKGGETGEDTGFRFTASAAKDAFNSSMTSFWTRGGVAGMMMRGAIFDSAVLGRFNSVRKLVASVVTGLVPSAVD